MAWRESVKGWVRQIAPYAVLLFAVVTVAAVIDALPARAGATAIGILCGGFLAYRLLKSTSRSVQIGALWFTAAVTADAAFAKLNDQAPFTLVNALTRVVDAAVKLADPLLRGLGLGAPDPKAKVAAVAPEFAWALVLSLLIALAVSFNLASRSRSGD